MITRTFRAPSVLVALEEVQRALGAEALVVSVRQVPGGPAWQVWRRPEVEVMAMTPGTPVRERDALDEARGAADPAGKPIAGGARSGESLAADVAQVKSTLSEVASRLDRFTLSAWPAALAETYRQLVSHGVDEALVRDVLTACADTLSPRALDDPARVREHVQAQLQAGIRVEEGILPVAGAGGGAARRVVCMVGTRGSGKTATQAKIAASHARALRLKVAWVCADTFRTGAIAQARGYAEALKLPLRVAYTPDELARAVAAESDADLVLVDTPGCNPRRDAEVVDLGALLTALPRRSTYLAVPATAKDADTVEALAAFGAFGLTGLVLTRLDETATFGSAFNAAWRSRLPIVYFANGPRTLEDLQPAEAGRLTAALFGENPAW